MFDNNSFFIKTWAMKNPFCLPLAEDRLWDDHTMV